MKRILVVDESRAVRETLVLVLERDYAVIERQRLSGENVFVGDAKADLLILGVSAGLASDGPALLRIVSEVPVPVLFLVDSSFAVGLAEEQGAVHFLAKPFNPYALKEKVARLLARSDRSSDPVLLSFVQKGEASRYLEFPRVPAFISALAKRYALTSLPILLLGEMGCGHEQVARALHSLRDQAGTWTAVHLAGMNPDGLSQQLRRTIGTIVNPSQRATLFLSEVETLSSLGQSMLLDFLEKEEKGGSFWLLSGSRTDLLEKVYRGEFLEALYYRLATLTLRLPPLRDRPEDIPSLASLFAQEYGKRLSLGQVTVSPEAVDRLRNYLWFGNLNEFEAVIARTLATHRKNVIQASDLVLGIPEEDRDPLPLFSRAEPISETQKGEETSAMPVPKEKDTPGAARYGNGNFRDMKVFINELAHELKNPMVTIKTFAQLLGDRFDDATFRARFRETVGGDIERMDELLEALLDFSRFSQPAIEKVYLYKPLSRVLEETLPEWVKKDATVRWIRKGETAEVYADEAHLRYAFKNILQVVLTQIRRKGEIELDVEGDGRVAVKFVQEADRISSFSHYLDVSSSTIQEEPLPLRLLLAKILLERNRGEIEVNHYSGGKVLIRTELPVP